MIVEAMSPECEIAFMEWVRERNPHFPLPELAFLMGVSSPLDDALETLDNTDYLT
ncbi:hypothetical protein [Mariprofundus sp. EBB-1]|uniref:hypothetical protein n=1 Tax=Mariprofundus sp. EBB-1 TaxID=2650971 RepID=UPI001293CDBE|nr:hypothetical protein [Mariprofundus sp. EBB-1]